MLLITIQNEVLSMYLIFMGKKTHEKGSQLFGSQLLNYSKTQVNVATGIYFIFKKRWSSQNLFHPFKLFKYY